MHDNSKSAILNAMQHVNLETQNILDLLQSLSPDSSKTTLRSWIKDGRVTIDGEIAKNASIVVQKGQKVELGARPRFIVGGIKIYYEDRAFIAIEKPAGLLSVATNFEKGKTAHALLKDHYRPGRVFVVHRIDQDTSGVMVFAFTEEARDAFKDKFEKHDIERIYIAIVEGQMTESKGTWQSLLYEDDNYKVHSTTDPTKGQIAITHFQVLATSHRYTALQLKLETGRKNQIRVHCQNAGHPIVGDKKYGAVTNPIKRLALHACHLALKHPITKQPLQFTSPIPEEFNKLISFDYAPK